MRCGTVKTPVARGGSTREIILVPSAPIPRTTVLDSTQRSSDGARQDTRRPEQSRPCTYLSCVAHVRPALAPSSANHQLPDVIAAVQAVAYWVPVDSPLVGIRSRPTSSARTARRRRRRQRHRAARAPARGRGLRHAAGVGCQLAVPADSGAEWTVAVGRSSGPEPWLW
jgi:hypothetical protein